MPGRSSRPTACRGESIWRDNSGPRRRSALHDTDFVQAVLDATHGRGVDVAFEAASGGEALQQAAEILAPGGRLIAVGINEDDRFVLKHSTLHRKGLTIRMVRRMKHSYPRAMRLVQQGQIDLPVLVSHHYPLAEAPEAFAANAEYREGVVKVAVDCQISTRNHGGQYWSERENEMKPSMSDKTS